jgi:hypothetical protein
MLYALLKVEFSPAFLAIYGYLVAQVARKAVFRLLATE